MKLLWLLFFSLLSFFNFSFQLKSHHLQKHINYLNLNGSLIINVFQNNTNLSLFNNNQKDLINFEDLIHHNHHKWNKVEINGTLYDINDAIKMYQQHINHTINQPLIKTENDYKIFKNIIYPFKNNLTTSTNNQKNNNYSQINNTNNTFIKEKIDTSHKKKYNYTIKPKLYTPIISSSNSSNDTELISINNETDNKTKYNIINITSLETLNSTNISTNNTKKEIKLSTISDALCLISNKTSRCKKCIDNAKISNITSKCECNHLFYYNITLHQCLPCHPLCTTCNGGLLTQCLSCKQGSFLSSSTCLCEKGYFYDPITLSCSSKKFQVYHQGYTQQNCSREKNEIWNDKLKQCISDNSKENIKYSSMIYYNNMKIPKVNNEGKDILGMKWNDNNGISSAGIRNSYLTGKYISEKYGKHFGLMNKYNNNNNNNVEFNFDYNDDTASILQNALIAGITNGNDINNSYTSSKSFLNRLNEDKQIDIKNINDTNPFVSSFTEIDENVSDIYFNSLPKIMPILSNNENKFSFSECKGVISSKNSQKSKVYSKLNSLTSEIDTLINLKSITNISEVTLSTMSQFISTYFIHQSTFGTTSLNLPQRAIDLMEEFYLIENVNIYYGDGDIKKYLIGSYINSLLEQIKNKISKEKRNVENAILSYKINNTFNLSSLKETDANIKIDISDEKTFFGLVEIINILTNKTLFKSIDLFTTNSITISFDLYKTEISKFDYNDYIINFKYETINQTDVQNELNSLFNNTKLYSIKTYINNNIVFDSYFDEFERILKPNIINESEIISFCHETKTKISFIISCISFGVIGLLEIGGIAFFSFYQLKFKN